jgi:hypothetical protein
VERADEQVADQTLGSRHTIHSLTIIIIVNIANSQAAPSLAIANTSLM